ncbi:MAG: YbaB/EbfC family nucleoid-associated protein [Coriobacteriia bacterium]|nr:YbaB/EbfC family nucleoid-associated protein [Coriobacteriia bacterium]
MNIQKMMKQAQQAQAKMAAVQEELKNEIVDASAGGGTVKVVMTGDMQMRSVKIDPAAAADPEDIEILSDMIVAAVNEALRAAQELANAKMSEAVGGVNIPGLM